MTELPECKTLLLNHDGPTLHITLNRPEARNAMSLAMVEELDRVFVAIEPDASIRAVVLRGAEGHFCAGGDIKDMVNARAAAKDAAEDPFYKLNRAFGDLITRVDRAPQVVIAVIQGAVMGGGFGLACVSDVAIAEAGARFGLPETSLGIPPAQIAPFVVKRLGLTQARRLALLGLRIDGHEAQRLGLVHEVAEGAEGLDAKLRATLERIRHCAPEANRMTKSLLLRVGNEPLEGLLDDAARMFSDAIQSEEGQEGAMAFMAKRSPKWAGGD